MNEVKIDVEIYDKIKSLAEEVKALSELGYIINITGIGKPTVLLKDAGFDALFPLGAEAEMKEGSDGTPYEVREVDADGVRWINWKKVDVSL